MLESERGIVNRIDKLILNMLKENMKIKKDKVGVIHDDEIEKVLSRIDEKLEVIFSLFQDDFSINERNIEERIRTLEPNLNFYDKVANNIIFKRLNNVMEKINNQKPIDGRLVSVCLDRKLFIEKVLDKNISLSFINKETSKDREDD